MIREGSNQLLPCFDCGYDLRGSPPAGLCPECGRAYRWETMYLDIARQLLKHVVIDVHFVGMGSVGVAVCVLCLELMARRGSWIASVASPALFQVGLLMAFFYAMLVVMYARCWIWMLLELHWHKTVWWGQVRGVGLSAGLLRGGAALALPLLVVAWF